MSWFSDAFTSVEDFFSNLWTNTLKPDVQKVEQVAEAFFSAAINDAATELGVTGLKIVTDAVTAAEAAGGTGTAKLAAAVSAVTSNLTAANINNVAGHVINAAIEGAVSQMNSVATVAPVAGPAPTAGV
jgi:hypothetical protein